MEQKEAVSKKRRRNRKKRPKTCTNSEATTSTSVKLEQPEEVVQEAVKDQEEIEMEVKKTREEILAERQAKKAAQKNKKTGESGTAKLETSKKEGAPAKTSESPVKKPDSPVKTPETPVKAEAKAVGAEPVKKENISTRTKKSPTRKPISPIKKPISPQKTPDATRKLGDPVQKSGDPSKKSQDTPRRVEAAKKTPESPRKTPSSPLRKPVSPAPPMKKPLSPKTPTTRKDSKESIASTPSDKSPPTSENSSSLPQANPTKIEKTKEQILAEREAKRLAKKSGKLKSGEVVTSTPKKEKEVAPAPATPQVPPVKKCGSDLELALKMETLHINEDKPPLPPASMPKPEILDDSKSEEAGKTGKPSTKAERRAIQEAQRAAKQKALVEKKGIFTPQKKAEVKVVEKTAKPAPSKSVVSLSAAYHKVKLFKHLYADKEPLDFNVNGSNHPAIVKLGVQYANDVIVGSNARCYAFLNALKTVINDYETPPHKDFGRCLESHLQPAMKFLQTCRPFAVSMTNALKFIKFQINQLNSNDSDSDNKEILIDAIDTYARDQIEKAAQAISISVQQKISNDDVILTYGASSLIKHILEEANRRRVSFRVIVVDSRPDHEGMEMLDSLVSQGIDCTYVLINAISFIMPEVTKVLLGAHALMANGYVMSRVGTAQIALVAKAFNVPVLVCCETHKFSERVQTDAFVHNEMGDPDMLVYNKNTNISSLYLKDWKSNNNLTPLNLRYDITPPELVTLVVTEIALLPCTSVPVILRVKPAEVA